jgi:hypothetical protein
MKSCRRKSLYLCFLLLFPPFFLAGIPANASDQTVTISVTAEMLKEVISDALPIPLETSGSYMKGDIVIDSMSDLRDHGLLQTPQRAGRHRHANLDR